MFISVLQMILLPIVLGVITRLLLGKHMSTVTQITPMLSIIAIVVIIAAIVAVSREKIITSGLLIFSIVALHNGLGLLLGYWASKFMKLDEPDSKAIAIEVGMQNSGLGAALAATYFEPISAVPSAIFSFWHNISGSILATYWSRKTQQNTNTNNTEQK
jgi:BASS family bile acid:Na+ symporter